jgi:hypothetical protein
MASVVRQLLVEMRCLLCSRGYELELDRLEQLPPCGPPCLVTGCGGTLFVADAISRWGADPADLDWDDDRPRRGRPPGRRREPQCA